MAKTVFNSDMVFHVWAQQTQHSGKRSDGRVFFSGRAIYSYGYHFALGYIFPATAEAPAIALLNATGYSVSTSKHKGSTRAAVSHMPRFDFPELTSICNTLDMIAGYPSTRDWSSAIQRSVREYLTKHVLTMTEEPAKWLFEKAFPRLSFAKFLRDIRAAEDKKAAEAKKTHVQNLTNRARAFAAMSPAAWAEYTGEFVMRHGGKPHAVLARDVAAAVKVAKLSPTKHALMTARLKAVRKAGKVQEAIDARGVELGEFHKAKDVLRAILGVERGRPSHSVKARIAANVIGSLSLIETGTLREATRDLMRPIAHRAERGDGFFRDTRDWLYSILDAISHRRDILETEKRAADYAEEQAKRAAWLAGENVRARYSDDQGRALVRAVGVEKDARGRIIDGTLETSHGATVPLVDAVKVFRMVKLVRERGEGWKRNGAMLPVGHFQVDAIDPSGTFQAGCHRIGWNEVERLAKELGVFDLDSDNTTIRAH